MKKMQQFMSKAKSIAAITTVLGLTIGSFNLTVFADDEQPKKQSQATEVSFAATPTTYGCMIEQSADIVHMVMNTKLAEVPTENNNLALMPKSLSIDVLTGTVDEAVITEKTLQKTIDEAKDEKESENTKGTEAATEETTAATETETEYVEPETEYVEPETEYVDQSYSSSDDETYLLACMIYVEAGWEPYDGQLAVGNVIMNRVESDLFPNSISEVIYQSGQFPGAHNGVLADVLANGPNESSLQAANDVLSGVRAVGDYLFFNGTAWLSTDGLYDYTVIGNQIFYNWTY